MTTAVNIHDARGELLRAARTALAEGRHMEAMALVEPTAALALERMVPRSLHPGMISHALAGQPVGGFLTALFSNDLLGTLLRADDENLRCLVNICRWVWWSAPNDCHGSRKRVSEWQAKGGLLAILENGGGQ